MSKSTGKLFLCLIIYLPLLVVSIFSQNKSERTEILLKHDNNAVERDTKNQLQRLLKSYHVSKWIFTKKIAIDQDAIPHSHPVLTLSTRHLKDDELLLSTFVHEQIHWFIENNRAQTEQAVAELKTIFPKVPVGFPEGAQDEESSYFHFFVCYLEYQADKELFGELKAHQIMEFWTTDHYTRIYKQMLAEEQKIGRIVRKYKLMI